MSILKGHLDSFLSLLPYAKELAPKGVGSRDFETAAVSHSMRAYSNFLIGLFDDLLEVRTFKLLDDREADVAAFKETDGFIPQRYPFKPDTIEKITNTDVYHFQLIGDYLTKLIDSIKVLSSRAGTFAK
ncbi:MAG: hypothetical protein Barrevirus19_7 [Barrevirus sp.]|uniref:Uncharacterized protein n=1 Tax=Barrevirus sp. TaxID=2487763 RepID=A0A3G4ZQN7_9VIRU|nr:MAG: hypothetical protein Barrevirus19_7 [Barrevirus sp.]